MGSSSEGNVASILAKKDESFRAHAIGQHTHDCNCGMVIRMDKGFFRPKPQTQHTTISRRPCHDPPASTYLVIFVEPLGPAKQSTCARREYASIIDQRCRLIVPPDISSRPGHITKCAVTYLAMLACHAKVLRKFRACPRPPRKSLEPYLSILTRTPIAGADVKNTRMTTRSTWMVSTGSDWESSGMRASAC